MPGGGGRARQRGEGGPRQSQRLTRTVWSGTVHLSFSLLSLSLSLSSLSHTRTHCCAGAIKNSVNFPTTEIPPQKPTHARLCIIAKNRPGMIGEVATLIGDSSINIARQWNTSKGETVSYTVIDMEDVDADDADKLQKDLITDLSDVRSTRVIWSGSAFEGPGSFYVKE